MAEKDALKFITELDIRLREGSIKSKELGNVVVCSVSPETLHNLILALKTVLEQHKRADPPGFAGDLCDCCGQAWPCWEVRMITDVLLEP